MSRFELTFTIPGNPGEGRVNAANKTSIRNGKINVSKTKRCADFMAFVALVGRSAKARDPAAAKQIRESPVVAAIVTCYWGQRRKLPGTRRLAKGDVDASIKSTLDPLQDWYGKKPHQKPGAGIFDDDGRVVRATLVKLYDKTNPRTEVVLWGLEREP